jgi:hypothetical protein
MSTEEPCAVTHPWHGIVRIVEHEARAFFYASEDGAYILPRRAFADVREFDEFVVAAARRYHDEARQPVRPEGQV